MNRIQEFIKQGRIVHAIRAALKLFDRRFLMRLLLNMTGIFFLMQVITLIILQVVSFQRRGRQQAANFPHPCFDDVIVGANRLRIYDYGKDLYTDMLRAIDEAKERIYLETYIWKGDEIGQAFKEHLARKAEEGVAVYVIYDVFANLVVPHSFKKFHPKIQVLPYQALRHPFHMLDPRRYALDHRKLLVVDGWVGFIGGYNIGKLYATDWRDTHLRIEGPAARDLSHSFVDFWNRHDSRGRKIEFHDRRHFDPLLNVRSNNALNLTFPIRDMYIEAIDRAENHIYLSNAYFVPDRALLDALKHAAQHGVDVRILVPWLSNHIVVDWLARGLFTECLEAGIRIFGYHDMLHAKTCTIDGIWSTIGTANLDRLSSVGNYEINIEIYSSELAHQMEELFNGDLTHAHEITLEEWISRPWFSRLGERILAPLRVIL
jgi:cardiolipin synthase